MHYLNAKHFCSFLILPLSLSACSISGLASKQLDSYGSVQEIKADISSILQADIRQENNPQLTTIQFNAGFADEYPELLNELLIRGYGVQRVNGDQGANFLDYSKRKNRNFAALKLNRSHIAEKDAR